MKLWSAENRRYSQNGEDGVIAEVFDRLGIAEGTFLEFGAHPGENNTKALEECGWHGFRYDAAPSGSGVLHAWVTPGNINQFWPTTTDLNFLSIDIDGQDYWAWKAFHRMPVLVCIEYNAAFRYGEDRVVPYDPDFVWAKDDYFGASLSALVKLGQRKGYRLLYCEASGTNAFFIREDAVKYFGPLPPPLQLWKPPGYPRHPHSERWDDDGHS